MTAITEAGLQGLDIGYNGVPFCQVEAKSLTTTSLDIGFEGVPFVGLYDVSGITVSLSGIAATMTQGTLSPAIVYGILAYLSGQSFTLSQGALLAAISAFPVVGSVNIQAGTLTTTIVRSMAGSSELLGQGSAIATITQTLSASSLTEIQSYLFPVRAVSLQGTVATDTGGQLVTQLDGALTVLTGQVLSLNLGALVSTVTGLLGTQGIIHTEGRLTSSFNLKVSGIDLTVTLNVIRVPARNDEISWVISEDVTRKVIAFSGNVKLLNARCHSTIIA